MLVVDASVALKWVFAEEGTDRAGDLLQNGVPLIAPEFVLAEVGNAAWRLLTQGKLTERHVFDAMATLPRMFTRLLPMAPLLTDALTAAQSLRHPIYDCFYLALAREQAGTLVTADRRLAEKVAGTDWDVVRLL